MPTATQVSSDSRPQASSAAIWRVARRRLAGALRDGDDWLDGSNTVTTGRVNMVRVKEEFLVNKGVLYWKILGEEGSLWPRAGTDVVRKHNFF